MARTQSPRLAVEDLGSASPTRVTWSFPASSSGGTGDWRSMDLQVLLQYSPFPRETRGERAEQLGSV